MSHNIFYQRTSCQLKPKNHFLRLFKIFFYKNSRLFKALKTIFLIQGYLKGLAQAKIIKKSVILFRFLDMTIVTATAADLQQQYLGSGCVRSTLRSYRCSCIGVVNY